MLNLAQILNERVYELGWNAKPAQAAKDDRLDKIRVARAKGLSRDVYEIVSRMLDEPEDKQRAADELNQFIVQNYLVVTHVAALRLLLLRIPGNIPKPTSNRGRQRLNRLGNRLHYAGHFLPLTEYSTMSQPSYPPATFPT